MMNEEEVRNRCRSAEMCDSLRNPEGLCRVYGRWVIGCYDCAFRWGDDAGDR